MMLLKRNSLRDDHSRYPQKFFAYDRKESRPLFRVIFSISTYVQKLAEISAKIDRIRNFRTFLEIKKMTLRNGSVDFLYHIHKTAEAISNKRKYLRPFKILKKVRSKKAESVNLIDLRKIQ